jgi:hypothetical protein
MHAPNVAVVVTEELERHESNDHSPGSLLESAGGSFLASVTDTSQREAERLESFSQEDRFGLLPADGAASQLLGV